MEMFNGVSMEKLISVVIPAYNAAKTIVRCLESVFCQEGVPYEVVVVDDGSTDETGSLVEKGYKNKVRYIRQENSGPAAARNRGIRESRGNYIAFLDADDEWLPGKLQLQHSALRDNPALGFCFTDMSHWVDGSELHRSYLHERGYRFVSSGRIYDSLLRECFVFTPSVVVPRAVLDEVGLFDETLRIAEDYDLWLRIADTQEVLFIDRPLVKRHRNGANITGNLLLYAESSISMMERLLCCQKGNQPRKRIISERLAITHNHAGYHCRKKGLTHAARLHFLKSLAYRPNLDAIKGLLIAAIPARMRSIE
jgi:glycosyltransferase involved in cell wall biosynthesis